MSIKIKYIIKRCFIIIFSLLIYEIAISQDTISQIKNDSLSFYIDTLITDTSTIDTSAIAKKIGIKSKVHYKSKDSIIFNISKKKAYMYGDAEINYETTKLESAYIDIDFNKTLIYAKGVLDSNNRKIGRPIFNDGEQNFKSETIKYNYETKKGLVKKVISQEGEGYLHGETVKKQKDNVMNIKHGSYTTCDKEHPHYEFRYLKAKVIPKNKIVTGPVYMVIEDVPIPLFLPFGWFPVFKGQTSGILLPTFGESANRGFYLENGGYYFGINDYLDFTLRGDIYSRGSWALKPTLRYKKRYKYNGQFSFQYAINVTGDKDTPSYTKNRDFRIRWSHTQDPKCRPNSKFSANVNIVSGKYTKYNPVSANDYLSNTFSSSIAYQANIGSNYHFTANMSHSQNIITKTIDMTVPKITFSANRFYPFRKKNKVGQLKWYDNISVGYTMNTENTISTIDTSFLKDNFFSKFRNGVKHSIPIQSTFKILKYFNVSNSINFTERWYSKRIEQTWVNDSITNNGVTTFGYIKKDTIAGFKAVRDFSYSSSINTRIYGMFNFGKKSPVRAIRHIFSPSVGFSYRPDFGEDKWGYYKDVQIDTLGKTRRYSLYESEIYGSPQQGKSGQVNFNITNNLEMKIRNRKDTITGTKKIVLIDNLSFSTSYNLAADSLNWAPLSISGRTKLFKKLNITYSSVWDPYVLDSTGTHNLNKFEWNENKRLFRHTNSAWNFGLSLRLNSNDFKKKKTSIEGSSEELKEIKANPGEYIDWDNPWNLSLNYNFRYINKYIPLEDKMKGDIIQTLSFNGNINITDKWKIGLRSGYDFINNEISYTSLNFYRDLHCWEMRFNWIPYGNMKSWNFTISAKSPLLKDLKLEKKKDFRDRYY
ncbi:MAG: LPS-assembly protein LptD [Bacteroidales bacterium]|nr:LPS-assembly protein LptD [Bacteroidales bacterium]